MPSPPCTNVKPPVDDFLATVLVWSLHLRVRVCKHQISTYLRWYTVAATYIIRHAAHSLAAFMGVRFDLIARRACWNLHCWATVISLHNLKLSVRCGCNACISETLIFIRPHLSNLFPQNNVASCRYTLTQYSFRSYTYVTKNALPLSA